MAAEPALQFLRSLERPRRLPALILIAGPQAFLREYVLDAARRQMTDGALECRSFQIGPADGFAEVINELGQPDLFASRKLVVCRVPRARREQSADSDDGGDSGRRDASGETAFADALARLDDASRLIVIYERDNAPAKVRRAAESAGLAINCLRPFESQLAPYGQVFARLAGFKLTADCADFLAIQHGDLAAMANAIAKAGIHRNAGGYLDESDFREPAAARAPDLFDLSDALVRGEALSALSLYERAAALGREPIEILLVELVPALRRMLLAGTIRAKGKSPAEVAGALGFAPSSPMAARAIEGARKIGLARLRDALHRAGEIDATLKMGVLKDRAQAIGAMIMELADVPRA